MAHTPGPWQADETWRTVKVKGRWQHKPTHAICPTDLDVNGCEVIADRVDNPADARLIVAALDLLVFAQDALPYLPVWLQDRGRAAIAKATGGES